MTANNRESFIFAFEGYTQKTTSSTVQEPNFGKGRGYPKSDTVQTSTNINPWLHIPPGSFLSTTHNRSVTRINGLGTKEWDALAYGAMSGQFTWTFNLDYKYIEPLLLVFEDYTYTAGTGTAHTHVFKKTVGKRVPSFVIRRVILNRVAGGPDKSDEITELYGCVVRNATFNKSSGTSQVSVTLTGIYADEKMWLGNLTSTDYAAYSGKLTEYMCMFAGEINDDNYVANTDSLEISIGNNLDGVYSTCSPFLSTYYEGLSDYEFSTSCYSTNPTNYKTRLYSGGAANAGTTPTYTNYKIAAPKAKGLTPMPLINLMSYSGSRHDDPSTYTNFSSYTSADEYAVFKITDCVIKSLTWPKADGSAIQDNISSTMCKHIELTIKSDMTDLTTATTHQCASPVEPDNTLKDSNNNEYEVSGTTVTIAKGSAGTGVIPNSSTDLGGIIADVLGSIYSTVTTINIGSGITSIGTKAFKSCALLISVFIPNTVTIIGESAFQNCIRLGSITIPTSVTSIGKDAFYNSALTSVTIPDSVTSIGESAFGSTSITSLTIGSGLQIIPESSFESCDSLSTVTIPNNITKIDVLAFAECTDLVTVQIGTGINTIEDAFEGCDALESITIAATSPPTLSNLAIPATIEHIYVPSDSVDTYKAAENWSVYASKISAITE